MMKNFKVMMPVMAFVMAVGLAFANEANVQTKGWINLNGVPTQLSSSTCVGSGEQCQVIFANDPDQEVHPVYKTSALIQMKSSSTSEPYTIE